MTPITPHQNLRSSADSRRQLEESVERAMARYRGDFEAVREKTARLRAEREMRESEEVPAPAPSRARSRKA